MSSETLNLVTTPIYTGAEDSTLAGIWRKILNDLQIPDEAIADRIDSYAEKVTKNFPEKLSQIRGNLRIDVTKAAMTWFTFTKCLRMLGVEHFEMEFTLHHLRKTSVHTLHVSLEDNFFESEKEKDDKTPSVLSSFFKSIQHDLGVGVTMFEALLEDYMRQEKLVMNLRNKTNVRGYLKKDFSSPKMSWRNFMKAMVFLCVLKSDIKLTLVFPKGVTSTHEYKILLGDMEDYSLEMKNDLGI